MTAERRMALRLASLEEADRAWLLSRLAPGEAERVRALLASADAAGLTRNRALLRAVIDEMAVEAPATATPLDILLSGLDAPAWRSLAMRLHGESPDAIHEGVGDADPWLDTVPPPAWLGVLREYVRRRSS